MAFFGLTALGPQNCFQVSLLDFSYLDVFTASDMEKAFNLVDREKRGFVHPKQVSGNLNRDNRYIHSNGRRFCLT